ncbi:MAG: tetratricopeptide repeat protein [Pseudomonadota bacterium]
MIELGNGTGGTGGGPAGSGPIDATDSTFMTEVIEASATTPVVALFWSRMDPQSQALGKELEKEVAATGGKVKLARVDIDQNVMVAQQLRLQAVPAAIAFFQRQGLDGFQGMASPMQIKEFLGRVLEAAGQGAPDGPGSLEDALTMAEEMLAQGQHEDALQTFAAIAAEEPGPRAIAGVARTLLAMGKAEEARQTLDNAPPEFADDAAITAVRAAIELAAEAADAGEEAGLRARIEEDPADHETRFELATALIAKSDNEGAVDELLEIFRRDREWNDGAAKDRLLKLFESLGPTDPVVAKGRRRLSSLIFS